MLQKLGYEANPYFSINITKRKRLWLFWGRNRKECDQFVQLRRHGYSELCRFYFPFLTQKYNSAWIEALGALGNRKNLLLYIFFIRLNKKNPFQLCWKFPLKIYFWIPIAFLSHWKITWLHSLYPMGCQSRSQNYPVAHHHGEKMVLLAWYNAGLNHSNLLSSLFKYSSGAHARWGCC